MNTAEIKTRYGIKYNPFLPAIPVEDIWLSPQVQLFFDRVTALVRDGGFAGIFGDPGLGKSKTAQALAWTLSRRSEDVVVGVMGRPQSKLSDFYRELGDLFGVDLSPANRYGGFKALRARWREHIRATLSRPVLLVDEAQEMPTACLNEIRLLGSVHFDSEVLLTTVLCGDSRLADRFRGKDLLPLGSRVRTRLVLEPYTAGELRDFLDHLLERAGTLDLLSDKLKQTLAGHSAGNPRVLCQTAAEMLAAAATRDLPQLDEGLYLELFGPAARSRSRRAG
jgi:type II secretory pathway predicted ATPase ExeA